LTVSRTCFRDGVAMAVLRVASVFFLLLVLAACAAAPDHPNHVELSGAANFRDVGGYATSDGRKVKRGMLYRSDDLPDLGTRDLEILKQLELKRIYDLRYANEKTTYPSRLPSGNSIEVVEIPLYYPPLDRAESKRKILDADVEDGHFQQLMIEANRAFALDYTAQWSQFLHGLSQRDDLPALVHCTDGKDRTGLAVALVLRTLGVPREAVVEDYLLSNQFLANKIDWYSFLGSMGSLFRVPASEIRPLLEVRRAYLEAAFAAIDERYGTFEAYLHDGLGLDDDTIERLRLAFLERVPTAP
jgi:protein-tyrosine phosphatase